MSRRLPGGDDQQVSFNDVILDLKVDGTTLTGTANLHNWPGLAPIADGKVEGHTFSFKWTGPTPSSGGYFHMTMTGIVEGDRMKLTMLLRDRKCEMTGERLPNQ